VSGGCCSGIICTLASWERLACAKLPPSTLAGGLIVRYDARARPPPPQHTHTRPLHPPTHTHTSAQALDKQRSALAPKYTPLSVSPEVSCRP
jgi:hypothetical protein